MSGGEVGERVGGMERPTPPSQEGSSSKRVLKSLIELKDSLEMSVEVDFESTTSSIICEMIELIGQFENGGGRRGG